MISAKNIAIIGGGAAGFFGAIRAADLARENGVRANVKLFEASSADRENKAHI
jgi:predicted flavoprotein YhiN